MNRDWVHELRMVAGNSVRVYVENKSRYDTIVGSSVLIFEIVKLSRLMWQRCIYLNKLSVTSAQEILIGWFFLSRYYVSFIVLGSREVTDRWKKSWELKYNPTIMHGAHMGYLWTWHCDGWRAKPSHNFSVVIARIVNIGSEIWATDEENF